MIQIYQKREEKSLGREFEILNSLGVEEYEISYLIHLRKKQKQNLRN